MNCPACGLPGNSIIRTEHTKLADRRRHKCSCGARWTSVARLERGSLSTPASNSDGVPTVIAPETTTNSGSTGRVYSESGIRSGNPDPDPDVSDHSERGRARSTDGAEFVRLLHVFTQRWERSYRRPYPVTPADKSQLGRFMKQNGNYIESFPAICDRYLTDRQAFTIQRTKGHTLAWLVTNGLALYGGVPRETAEQYSARVRREHEARKLAARRPPTDPRMRDLLADLANKKAAIG